jgi:hypothetical protein
MLKMFNFTRNLKHVWVAIALTLIIVLMTFTIAYAAFISINTNDGLVDSNWPATPFLTDPTGDAAPGEDIQNFWVGTDANPPTVYFFRAQLATWMPTTSNYFLETRLDCNNNGSFFDSADVVVDYSPMADLTDVLNGTFANEDTQPNTFGEVTNATGVYEWKAATSGPNVNWGQCKSGSHINVMLATVDPTFIDVDTTSSRGFNVPTAVTLRDLSAQSSAATSTLPLAVLVLALGVGALLITRRRLHQA